MLVLVLGVAVWAAGAAPTGTIGVSEVDVLVQSDFEFDEEVAAGI